MSRRKAKAESPRERLLRSLRHADVRSPAALAVWLPAQRRPESLPGLSRRTSLPPHTGESRPSWKRKKERGSNRFLAGGGRCGRGLLITRGVCPCSSGLHRRPAKPCRCGAQAMPPRGAPSLNRRRLTKPRPWSVAVTDRRLNANSPPTRRIGQPVRGLKGSRANRRVSW
jgi:hypothetical protein